MRSSQLYPCSSSRSHIDWILCLLCVMTGRLKAGEGTDSSQGFDFYTYYVAFLWPVPAFRTVSEWYTMDTRTSPSASDVPGPESSVLKGHLHKHGTFLTLPIMPLDAFKVARQAANCRPALLFMCERSAIHFLLYIIFAGWPDSTDASR